jgi:hypothetical protein
MAPLILLFAALGCGGSTTVNGEVQIDGTPVENGTITFEPADGKGPVVGGPITHGHYEVTGLPGKKNVLITSSRSTGKKVPAGPPAPAGTMVDEVVVFPPPGKKHEPKSVELAPGSNTFSVQLTSSGASPSVPGRPSGPSAPSGPSGPSGPTK